MTNVVGIMIILVMAAGVRVKSFAGRADAELVQRANRAEREANSATADLNELEQQIQQVQTAVEIRRRERLALLAAAKVAEAEYADELSQPFIVSDAATVDDDELKAVEAEIARLQSSLNQVKTAAEEEDVEEVESLPTPLAKAVTGEELHLHLADGKLAVVPVDDLIARFREDAVRTRPRQPWTQPGRR